jgi:O-antigen ligase
MKMVGTGGESLGGRYGWALGLLAAMAGGILAGRAVAQENWSLVVVLLGGVGLLLLIRWPFAVMMGIYAAFLPSDSIFMVGAGSALTRLLGAGAAAVLLATGLAGRRFIAPPRAAVWWILFVGWAALTSLWTLDTDGAMARLPMAVSLLALYLVAVSTRVTRNEFLIVTALAVVGAMVAAGYSYFAFSEGVSYGTTHRASLIAGDQASNPNDFAAGLLLPFALAVGGFLAARHWIARLLTLLAVLVIGGGILMTMSRGALLGLITMVVVFLYRSRADWRLVAPVALLGGVVAVMPDLFFERLQLMLEGSGAGREDIWANGLKAMEHSGVMGAVFGVGLDSFASTAFGRAPHNIYLGMLVEVGVVGLVLLFGAMVSQLRSVGLKRRGSFTWSSIYLAAIESACFGVLVVGFFGDIVWRKHFWFLWALLPIAARVREEADLDGGEATPPVAAGRPGRSAPSARVAGEAEGARGALADRSRVDLVRSGSDDRRRR